MLEGDDRAAAPSTGRSAPARLEAARRAEVSPGQLLRLALDDNLWVRRQAAANPAFPTEELEIVRRAGSSADLASFAPPDPTLPPATLARLAEGGEWGRRLAARHPATPAEVLLALGGHSSASLRADLAANPWSPPELAARLLADADLAVRQAAARRAESQPDGLGETGAAATDHPKRRASPYSSAQGNALKVDETLALLRAAGASPDLAAVGAPARELAPAERDALIALGPFARRLAAGLPDLTAEQLEALAGDAHAATRAALASNPSCPPSVLLCLADDDEPGAQQALLANPQTPAEALALLAADLDDTEILTALARHPAAPADLLARLAEHGAGRGREAAAAHPSCPPAHRELLRRAGASANFLGFAEPDPALPSAELARLARSGAWGRLLAARHPATGPEDLAHLAADADLLVRQEAARNPRLPAGVLDLLIRAGSTRELDGIEPASAAALAASDLSRLAGLGPWGRRLAARHPGCYGDRLAELANDPDPQTRAAVAAHPRSDATILAALAQDISAAVRWELVKRPDLFPAIFALLARDPIATLRAAVAGHPSCSPEVRGALALDPDEDVRAAAGEGGDRESVG